VWDTSGAEGDYLISVWVRNAGSSNSWEAWDQIPYTINLPLKAALISDVPTPQARGNQVLFTGSATGGAGQYEYLFRLKSLATNSAATVQDYSSDNTWVWDTSGAEGDYLISVWVRNAGSSNSWEAWDQIPYRIE
jgi:hypothetical protein